MPNKPHPPRNKNNKKAPPVNADGEDTSFIVFSNKDDKNAKKAKQPTNPTAPVPSSSGVKGKAVDKTGPPPEAEKKPDTRTLIAGSSWTGKLPQTLFNEHCQKQKWEKPEYTMHGNATKGFTGGVIIRQKNPKTQEVTQLPAITPPPDYVKEKGTQPSAVEARHFAAAYALYRVSNMKNIHMMLPPQYRDLWKGDFETLKATAVEGGQGYLYEADPFLAKKHRDEAQVAKEKARADKAKAMEEDKKSRVVGLDGQVQSKSVLKGWSRTPKVEMGAKIRREVERLVRNRGVWNPYGVRLSQPERNAICEDLSKIGFRKSHVEEATEFCKDREECLEWLLIHVPEDDLPRWSLPENYLAGVSLVSGDMIREAKLKRLATSGYASDVCAEALEQCNGNEQQAGELLQRRLLNVDHKLANVDGEDGVEVWNEEMLTLEAIFVDRFTNHDRVCDITLELQTSSRKAIKLRARHPIKCYPNKLPILAIEADLPAYIRLSILRHCLLHAQETFIGEQMLFDIIDWMEHNIPEIIEKPGRLSEIARVSSTFAESKAGRAMNRQQSRRMPKPISWSANSSMSQRLLSEWSLKQSSPEQLRMMHARQSLPAWKMQESIVSSVNTNQVTIISGETGSGKSTQSVQFILDDLLNRCLGEHANIVCTQPRRISALALADRVADERCSKVGDEVGYAIRGESKHKAGVTKISFVTTGVLLRRLQTSGGSTEDVVKSLADVSHVVIDEVHERSLDTDFLLVLLRDVLSKRKDLKLILMSATLDAGVFESYLKSVASVGKVEIEGRTYPVQDFYLDDIAQAVGFSHETDSDFDEDFGTQSSRIIPASNQEQVGKIIRAVGTRINYELIARTVEYIDNELGTQDGGILIFLPGVAEIDQTLRALRGHPNLHALPLHASLQSSEQRLVFKKPPSGKRKVVAATNVAETSITIEDIVAVIDTGRVKETSYDPSNNMVKLAEVWASKSACKQRRGRAGRVRAGKCYKLYTKAAEAKMAERPDPEIRRVPLEQLCLSVRAMGIADVPGFLASALTPPESLAVEGSLALLGRMGALDGNEMTALGRHLSMIPADLRCGKLLVYGAAFQCLDACLTIAAILTVKSPFVNPQTKREESKSARASFGNGQGDLICDLHAYEQWADKRLVEPTSSVRRWCDDSFLNHQTLMDISTNRRQYVASLQELGFIPPGDTSITPTNRIQQHENDSDALVRALVAGSFQPQLARIDFPDKKFAASSSGAVELDPEARTIKYFDEDNGRVFVHPSSTLFDAQGFPGNSVYMSYFTKMATSKVFVRELTPFNVFSLLMFSGPITIDPQGRGLVVDGWCRVRGWARLGVLVSRLRMIFDDTLAHKIDEPGFDISSSEVVGVVKRLVELDGLDR